VTKKPNIPQPENIKNQPEIKNQPKTQRKSCAHQTTHTHTRKKTQITHNQAESMNYNSFSIENSYRKLSWFWIKL
jgi:hypothetical protein